MQAFFSINFEQFKEFGTEHTEEKKEDLIHHSNLAFTVWRSFDLTATFFSMLSIITSTINYEINYPSSRHYSTCPYLSQETEFFRIATMILSLSSVIFIVCRYFYKGRWILLLQEIDKHNLAQRRKKYRNTTASSMIAEILLILIFPYPYLDLDIYIPLRYNFKTIVTCYKISEFLYCIMFFRFYLLLRAISNYTIFQNESARMQFIKYNVNSSLFLSCKCMLIIHPLRSILFVGVFSAFFTAVVCRIFERPFDSLTNEDFGNTGNAL